jgi:hypothetical protein
MKQRSKKVAEAKKSKGEITKPIEKKGNGNGKTKVSPVLLDKVKKLYPSKFKHSTSIARALGIERKIAQKAMRLIEAK